MSMPTMQLSPIKNEHVTKNEFAKFQIEMRAFRFEFNDFRGEMYVFKNDMYEFRDEIYSFRTITEKRFDGVDKRLDILAQGLAGLREDIPRYMSIIREGFRDDLNLALEYICEATGLPKNRIDFPKL